MSALHEIHNLSAALAIREIVQPTIDGGGDSNSVCVVLTSVITGVLLTIYYDKPRLAAGMLERAIVPAVLERLSKPSAGGT